MMEAYRSPIILGSVVAYMVLCVVVGLWAMRRTRSTRDFFMAGRNIGIMVTGVAIFSSTMSGFGFVGGPGLVYSLGMSSVWMILSAAIGHAIIHFLAGKRLRMFAGLFDSVSLPDAVAVRYQSETARFLSAIAILLGVMGYLATQILAMATVLQSILQRTQVFAGIELLTCVVISCSVLVFYCVTGGIVASVYTDMVQGGIMVVAGVLIFITAISVVDGGASGAVSLMMADDPEAIGPWGTIGMLGCISWYLMFAVGYAGQPHLLTKAMMIKRLKDYRYIPAVTICGFLLTALLWIGIGLAMRALVVSGAHPELAGADAAAPVFLQQYAHPLLAGVVFAGLFAAIMSTADGFLNIGAAALVHDIPHALRGHSAKHELFWARTGTIILAVVAALFALYSHYENQRLVALLGAFGWGTFGAALVPAVAIGFNWKRATPMAANIAIASSLVVNFAIEVFDIHIPGGLHGGTVSLLVSVILFLGISLASKPPALDPDVEAVMDL
jgi:SSS family transporter